MFDFFFLPKVPILSNRPDSSRLSFFSVVVGEAADLLLGLCEEAMKAGLLLKSVNTKARWIFIIIYQQSILNKIASDDRKQLQRCGYTAAFVY